MEISEVPAVKKHSKSKVFCSVFGCNSKASRNPDLSYHTFPAAATWRTVSIFNKYGETEKMDVRKAWEKALRMGKHATKYMRICSLHFKESDYFPHAAYSKKKFLKKDAVPSRNLPQKWQPPPRKSTGRVQSHRASSHQHVNEPAIPFPKMAEVRPHMPKSFASLSAECTVEGHLIK